jgi:hypothetical protein
MLTRATHIQCGAALECERLVDSLDAAASCANAGIGTCLLQVMHNTRRHSLSYIWTRVNESGVKDYSNRVQKVN